MPDVEADVRRAVRAIEAADMVTLACHVGPDGDALGSMLGLMHALRGAGRAVTATFPSPFVVADHYRLLPGLDLLAKPSELSDPLELLVTFDAGSLARLGDLAPRAQAARELVVVDHHVSNTRFGTINVIDPDAPASAAIAVRLIDELGLPIADAAATCLYAGLVCDTGRFQYDSTTPEVFELASRLTRYAVPVAPLTRSLFEEHRYAYMKLLGEALGRAELDRSQRFVWVPVTRELLARHDVTIEETEGLIDVLRRTTEADVSCVLKEEPDGRVRVSLRSVGGTDVCAIAQGFGGGGHRLAAGFTADGDVETLVRAIRAAL